MHSDLSAVSHDSQYHDTGLGKQIRSLDLRDREFQGVPCLVCCCFLLLFADLLGRGCSGHEIMGSSSALCVDSPQGLYKSLGVGEGVEGKEKKNLERLHADLREKAIIVHYGRRVH